MTPFLRAFARGCVQGALYTAALAVVIGSAVLTFEAMIK